MSNNDDKAFLDALGNELHIGDLVILKNWRTDPIIFVVGVGVDSVQSLGVPQKRLMLRPVWSIDWKYGIGLVDYLHNHYYKYPKALPWDKPTVMMYRGLLGINTVEGEGEGL